MPRQAYVSIVPLALRVGVVVTSFAATGYLALHDRQPFHALARLFDTYLLGFLITLLVFLLPCVIVIYGLAAALHHRRRQNDFPTATIHKG